ncbi:hypothetical protein [Lignipirellula cremea]|uniref:Uncharacterized protein n=1 Tax=Lignipirellula cremea TaxID=2528010 RepID=A0A518DN38_9BACT|nr:hypothetical protein [Lignipirellula cremea]QDU93257.1 hypothetical protein Pla8534_10360 [Lignipirellula cremea]
MSGELPAGRMLRVRAVEAFAALNLAFLSFDVYLAHSANAFAHPAEWIPIPFGVTALALATGVVRDIRGPGAWWGGAIVGLLSILVGLAGMFLHLDAVFFETLTLKSLVFTAPFSAPLAYVGVGLLLWLNRMETGSADWGRWVLMLAWGGFLGNFALSALDHAQNGFFHPTEWISVFAAAAAVGVLLMVVLLPRDRILLASCAGVLLLEAGVGVLGAGLHLIADLEGASDSLWDNLVYGAPVFAPLLFTNLALLAAIGLWDLFAPETAVPAPARQTPAASS